jgi:hypothetical protein
VEKHRQKALELYQNLYEKTPKNDVNTDFHLQHKKANPIFPHASYGKELGNLPPGETSFWMRKAR